jgi:hypothetical protein
MTVVIIGVDPGLSTGVSVLADARLSSAFQGMPEDALNELDGVLRRWTDHCTDTGTGTVLVACERFQAAGRSTHSHQPDAERVFARTAALASLYGVDFVEQTPADAKRIASDALLRRNGLWTLPRDVGCRDANDANDAMRHAVLLLARRRATMFNALLTQGAS